MNCIQKLLTVEDIEEYDEQIGYWRVHKWYHKRPNQESKKKNKKKDKKKPVQKSPEKKNEKQKIEEKDRFYPLAKLIMENIVGSAKRMQSIAKAIEENEQLYSMDSYDWIKKDIKNAEVLRLMITLCFEFQSEISHLII